VVETSVIIAVRDGERFLGEAIQSVLAQISAIDELIVVNDGSTDRSAQIAASTADPRMRLIHLEGRGVSAARNWGISAASGRFIAFLDHDDLWPAGRHRMLIEALRRNEGAGAAYGRIRISEEDDVPVRGGWAHLDGQHLATNVFSALYRAEPLRSSGGFCESMVLGEDTDLQLRLLESGLDPVRCDGDSLIHRRHGANTTNDKAAVERSLIMVARRKRARAVSIGPH
jgi:cellulose synthase/poly-beta-1,6-N-acetylglucosamine synthase-like glycosyltransferase